MYLLSKQSLEIIKPLAAAELEQTSFYKRMAIIANKLGFLKAEKFFIAESKEENEHYLGWQDYVVGRGNDFVVPSVEEQSFGGDSLHELFDLSLNKEVEVIQLYNNAYGEAIELDIPTALKIQEYINIQIEAIKYYTDLVAVFKGLDKGGEISAEHLYFEEN